LSSSERDVKTFVARSEVFTAMNIEADHSPQSSAKVKNSWSYTSTPPIRFHGVVLS